MTRRPRDTVDVVRQRRCRSGSAAPAPERRAPPRDTTDVRTTARCRSGPAARVSGAGTPSPRPGYDHSPIGENSRGRSGTRNAARTANQPTAGAPCPQQHGGRTQEHRDHHSTGHGEDRAFKGKVTLFAIAAAAVGGFLFGFDSSVINGAVDAIKGQFDLSDAASGFAVASALIGCAFGAYFAGRLADRWGRTRVMFWAAVLFFVSSIGSAFAFATWDFVLWRLIGGLGIGTASVIAPAYISEVAPKAIRGAWPRSSSSRSRSASSPPCSPTSSSPSPRAVPRPRSSDSRHGAGCSWSASSRRWSTASWRSPAESPRYLLTKGRTDDAREVMGKIVPRDTVNTSLERSRTASRRKRTRRRAPSGATASGCSPSSGSASSWPCCSSSSAST